MVSKVCIDWAEGKPTKVGWPLDDSWQNSSLQIFIFFHHFFVPFGGFEPHPRRIFLKKSDIKWAFSYILIIKSNLINLRGQDNLKTQN